MQRKIIALQWWPVFPLPKNKLRSKFMAERLTSVGFSGNDLESLRARLRKMTEAELQRDIQLGERMCSPQVNFGRPPHPPYVIQLREAKAEQERRKATANAPDA
jgi:hypothetical protein